MPIDNPWHDLPVTPPYVLPCDMPAVAAFNSNTAKKNLLIQTNLLPEPFFGPLDAPVVVLLLNPGVGGGEEDLHKQSPYKEELLAALKSEKSPHFHLREHAHGPGYNWWSRVAGSLIKNEEIGQKKLSENLLCLEYFPYHSINFKHTHLRLPSQEFTFDQVRRAMAREAVIVSGRGFSIWCGAVPELANYPWICKLKSRNAAITSGNTKDDRFPLILKAITKGQIKNLEPC